MQVNRGAGTCGEVQHDRGPELDVGLQHPVRAPGPQLGQRGLLQRSGDLVARGVEFLRGAPQHPGTRILAPGRRGDRSP